MAGLVTGLMTLAIALSTPSGAQTPADAALDTAGRLVNGAYAALTDDGLADSERNSALRRTIDAAFAFEIWERFLLGDRAGELTDAQKEEFRQLLPGFIADLYRTQFGKGLQDKPRIEDVRKARRDMLVRASIPRANGKILPVDWRIRDFGERGHLVIDIMVGGTSFLILKRDEFLSIIDRQGPEALLAYLREHSIG